MTAPFTTPWPWSVDDNVPRDADAATKVLAEVPDFARPAGQLWERESERSEASDLQMVGEWLGWVEPDCGRCAPPYGCPPGSHGGPLFHRGPAQTYPGYYRDRRNGDLWHLAPGRGGWSWVNGGRFRFIPYADLEWVDEPNPFA